MPDDLEGEKTLQEGGESTPAKEEKEPTLEKEKPTVSITETPEFRKALDKALGKGLESTNRQLSLQRQAAEAAKAEAEEHKANVSAIEAELQDLQRQHDELVEQQFADDPEARRAYTDRRAIADERRKLAKKTAEVERKLYEAEKLAWSVSMARKADTLVKETGIDPKELEDCQTEEEMEVKALRFKLTKEPEKEADKTPKFDSGVSSGGGMPTHPTIEQLDKMSPAQYAEWYKSRKK